MKCFTNVRSSWFIVLFQSSISLLIFSLVLTVIQREVKSDNCLFLLLISSVFDFYILELCHWVYKHLD